MDWFNALAAPVLLTIGGLVTWLIRSRIDEYRELERNLASRQIEVYWKILDPFAQAFAGRDDPQTQQRLIEHVKSTDFMKATFDLTMFGSDDVVFAYNRMMQYMYRHEDGSGEPRVLMELWGSLRLEMRKSVGNKRTKLDAFDMLEGMIKDIDKLRKPPAETLEAASQKRNNPGSS